jgi:peptide/nickel transport system substrate-binding protein
MSDEKRFGGNIFERKLSRRRLVQGSTGAFAAAVLSGAAVPAGMGRLVMAQSGKKEMHVAWPYSAPPKGHWNAFVTDAILANINIYGDLLWQPGGLYYWSLDQWMPIMATEWGFMKAGGTMAAPSPTSASATPAGEGVTGLIPSSTKNAPADADTFQVKYRTGAKWDDGSDFTADDVLTTFSCLRIMSNTVWQYVDKIEKVDDSTVSFHMSKPSTVVERYVIRQNIQAHSLYGDWAKKADDLFGSGKTIDDPEGKQLLDQFNKFRPTKVVSSGPFTVDLNSITSANYTFKKNDTAWNADKVTFDSMVNYNGETDTISVVVLDKKIDYATHGFAPATEKQMLSEGIRVVRPPVYSGPALFINYGKLSAAFNDPKTRQAIAMAVDRQEVGTVALAASGIAQKYMTGMSDNFVPLWMSQDDIAKLNQYEHDQDKAASLLKEAGWTQSGNSWKTPDGKDAAWSMTFPAEFADWSAAGQNVADQLTKFGIKIEPRAVTFTQQPVDVDKGNFELAIQGWGSSSNPHPSYSFIADLFTHNTLAINNGGKGMAYPLQQTLANGQKVDLNALVVDSAVGMDIDKQKGEVTAIATAFNELLPIIPFYERYGNNAVLEGVRVQPWPADSDPIYKNSPYADGLVTMLMLEGRLKPV